MNRRYAIYLGVIALLAAIIIGRWWLHAANGEGAMAAGSRIFLAEDFHLRVETNTAADAPRRDLFQPVGKAATRTSLRMAKPVAVKAMVQAPAKSEPTEAEVAGAELGKIKLLGVVFRGNKGQAYLSRDKENFMAYGGDTVLGRFVVEKVSVDTVDLRDLKTNISRRVPVSGK